MNQDKGDYTFRYQISKTMELISNDWLMIHEREKGLPLVEMSEKRSLLILLTWVNSKRTHAYKYVDIYLERGFDVLVVSTSAWQMLVPVTGVLVTCSDLADFLNENQSYHAIVIHAFSVGCFVWCFTEEQMSKNRIKYQKTIDRLAGCIMDSPPVGKKACILSYLVFKEDSIFRVIGEQLIHLSLLLTYFIFLKYFEHGSHLFFNPDIKLPRLLLISKDDPISPYKVNLEVCEVWKSKGVQVKCKMWEKSVHVSHFLYHRQEYLNQIESFFVSIGIPNTREK